MVASAVETISFTIMLDIMLDSMLNVLHDGDCLTGPEDGERELGVLLVANQVYVSNNKKGR